MEGMFEQRIIRPQSRADPVSNSCHPEKQAMDGEAAGNRGFKWCFNSDIFKLVMHGRGTAYTGQNGFWGYCPN